MRLFIGGLNYETKENDLRDYFTTNTIAVVEAVVVKDRDSGRSKGYGFVTLQTERDLADVISEFNNSRIMGKTVTVGEAKPQTPRRR